MPQLISVPEVPGFNFEDKPLIGELAELGEELEKQAAISLVLKTFEHYRAARQSDIEPAWSKADELYFGIKPRKMWPNSNVERANFSSRTAFYNIETATAIIYEALFGGQEWFSVVAEKSEEAELARQVRKSLKYFLESNPENRGATVFSELLLAIKNMLTYGNCCLALEWNEATRSPNVVFVDVRDMYFDPRAGGSSVDFCASVIRRQFVSIEKLREWREGGGMNVPDDDTLYSLAEKNTNEETKNTQDGNLGVTNRDSYKNPFPNSRLLEVLGYYSNKQIVFVLGRKHVLFSSKNPYDFLPFVVGTCYLVPGKLWGKSFTDVLEGPQKYIEGLLNGHLDELTLSLHPPRIQKRGAILTSADKEWGPGATTQADSPEDVQFFKPNAATTSVFDEINFLQQTSDKLVGISPLSSGLPSPSNANRTGAGMRMQLQGTQLRMMMLVRQFEEYVILPMLYKLMKMLEIHRVATPNLNPNNPTMQPMAASVGPQAAPPAPPDGGGNMVPGIGEGGATEEYPATIFGKKMRFFVEGSTKMLSRDKIMQVLPSVLQTVGAQGFIQQLQSLGQTVDFKELMALMLDGTGISGNYNLIRQMNQQEIQAAQQPNPELVARQQATEQTNQTKLQLAQIKAESTKAEDNPEMRAMELQFKQQEEQLKLQVAAQKAQIDLEVQRMKLELEKMKMQLEQQKMMQQMSLERERAQMGMMHEGARRQQEMEVREREQEQAMRHAEAEAAAKKEIAGIKPIGGAGATNRAGSTASKNTGK